MEIPSKPPRPTTTSEECGFLCYQDPGATCGYFVHASGDCYMGSLDNAPVAVPAGTPDAIVHVFNSKANRNWLVLEQVHEKCKYARTFSLD